MVQHVRSFTAGLQAFLTIDMTFSAGIVRNVFDLTLSRLLYAFLRQFRLATIAVALAILSLTASSVAWAQTGAKFSNMVGPATAATAGSAGTYAVIVSGTALATATNDEVVDLVLYDGTTVLSRVTYAVSTTSTGLISNVARNFSFNANLAPGSHSLSIHADTYQGWIATSTAYPITVAAAAAAVDGATFISQSSIPTSMVVGQSYPVTVTFQNTGSTTWTAAAAYYLGSAAPQDNQNFGLGRVSVGSSVAPNAQYTFSFNVTPTTAGSYTFQWGMLQEQVHWFGGTSTAVPVTVSAPPVPTFTSPTSNISVVASGSSATVSFSGSATASSGATVSKLELIEGTTTFATGTTSITASRVLAVGVHTIQLKATDSRGGTAVATRTVTVTSTPPTASISSPANGATFSLTTATTVSVPVTASAASTSGGSISSMRLYADGVLKQTVTTSTLSTAVALASGTHTLAVEATDSNGTISTRNSISVTVVAASAPTATLAAPTDGLTLVAAAGGNAATAVNGTATAVGGSAVTKVELLDNGVVVVTSSTTTGLTQTVSFGVGKHALTLRATNAAGAQGLSPTKTITVLSATQGVGATFLSQSVPATLRAGQPYTITVQMLNSGTTTWISTGSTPFRLGTQNPEDNRNWNSTARAYLTGSVATGGIATFTIPVTAPTKTGIYSLQWQMVQDFVSWFGDMTPAQSVVVTAGTGLTPALSATSTNVRVSGAQTATVAFTASASGGSAALSKLELFQGTDTTDYSNTTPVASNTVITLGSTWSPKVSVPAGVYLFKLRATDVNGVATESKTIMVNVTNSPLLGTTSGVRTNSSGNPEMFGWVCQPGSATALGYKVYLDAPTPSAGGTLLTSGTANVTTESDNASVQTTCSTPGTAHDFVVNLSTYISQYAGRSLYVLAQSADASQTVTLPCADNSCTMPGTQQVALATPLNGDKVVYPGPVFARMKLTNYTGTYDEVGFYVNGQWTAAQPDATAGFYAASISGLVASATPYTIYAKVRQGNTTVVSMQNQFTMVSSMSISLTAPASGASLQIGTPQVLTATVAGTAQSVKFFANGAAVATATGSGATWSASWTPTVAGSVTLTAIAYDGSGAQLAQSPGIIVGVNSAAGGSGANLSQIVLPHMANPTGGTLPGDLSVDANGNAVYQLSLVVPPGTAGMQPQLSLSYSSAATNGMLGVGWNLNGISTIHRCGKTIAQDGVNGRVAFATSDRLCLDGQRLVPVLASGVALSDASYWADGVQFRTELNNMARITAQGTWPSRTFKVEYKDGRIAIFGTGSAAVQPIIGTVNSGLTAPQPTAKTGARAWAVASITDRVGNYINFTYDQNGTTGEHHVSTIRYGGLSLASHAAVVFQYEARDDAWTRYVDETRDDIRTRVNHIRTYVGSNLDGTFVGADGTIADTSSTVLVRDYILKYQKSATSGRSLLSSVQLQGSDGHPADVLPPTSFRWGQPDTSKTVGFESRGYWANSPNLSTHLASPYYALHPEYFSFIDFDRDGLADALEKRVTGPAAPSGEVAPVGSNPITAGTMQTHYRYFHNTGTNFQVFNYQLNTGEAFVVMDVGDFNGDGLPDLLVATGSTAKICLSPLGNAQSFADPNATIVFNCTTMPAQGSNVTNHPVFVVDVLGEGRSAHYGHAVGTTNKAYLCIQNNACALAPAPNEVANPKGDDGGSDYSPHNYSSLAMAVDFAGTGKPYDVAWSKFRYVKYTYDGDQPFFNPQFQNMQPVVSIQSYVLPDGTNPGPMASYAYPAYPTPVDPTSGSSTLFPKVLPPYTFDTFQDGASIYGDFNGSGYNGLAYGFLELVYTNSLLSSYSKANFTICLSTGRALDCHVRAKYSGTAYRKILNGGNFVGDGAPSLLVGTMTYPTNDEPLLSGNLEMCRLMGDDTTGDANDANISCVPWTGVQVPTNGTDRLLYMDLLGTGRTQLVLYHGGAFVNGVWTEPATNQQWEVFAPKDVAHDGEALDRIVEVDNGIGAAQTVRYDDGIVSNIVATSTDTTLSYPQQPNRPAGKVVSQLNWTVGGSSVMSKSYQYKNSATDVAGRGSLGFGQVIETDNKDSIATTTTYAQTWPYTGMATRIDVSSGGCVVASKVNQLQLADLSASTPGASLFPYAKTSTVIRKDLGTDKLCRDLGTGTTTVTYGDGFGNVTAQTSTLTDGTQTVTTQVTTGFENGASAWLIGHPLSTATTKTDSLTGASVTRTTTATYNQTTGLIATKIIEPNSTFELDTSYARNAFGLVQTQTDTWTDPSCSLASWPDASCVTAKTRVFTTIWDAKGRYVVTTQDPLLHMTNFAFDAGTGARLSETDPNQLTTTWTVDAFGRQATQTQPDGTRSTSTIKQCAGDCTANATVAMIVDTSIGGVRSAAPVIVYTDSAGHAVLHKTWGFDGRAILAEQTYDDHGRPDYTNRPHYDQETAYIATYQQYDNFDRVVTLSSPDEQGTLHPATTSYQGTNRVLTNLLGQARTETRNVLDQIVKVTDALGGTTTFGYEPFGALTSTIDPGKNTSSILYDRLGRRIELHDPDLGFIEYKVDPIGQTYAQISPIQRPVGKRTANVFDLSGRMTARYETDLVSHWIYDTATYGVGQLAEAYTGATEAGADYKRVHTYDQYGRPATTTQKLSDGSYLAHTVYDSLGRLSRQEYQRGTDAVKGYDLQYNGMGYLYAVGRNGLQLWQATAQDAAQQVLNSALGNGLAQTRVYNAYTGRMSSGTLTQGANALLTEGYMYDLIGSMLHRSQYWSDTGFMEDFTYDKLNRLQTSTLNSQQLLYQYDGTGNLTAKGAAIYTYPVQGSSVQPHAVQSVSGISGAFAYDADGNQTNGNGRFVCWTSFDMPSVIALGGTRADCSDGTKATFTYGTEHQRLRQIRGDGTTVVYAGAQEVETNASGVTVKTYWPNGIGVEIDKPGATTSELHWTHKDRLDSVIGLTGTSGTLASQDKLSYDPWGKRRDGDVSKLTDDRGFTGQEMLDQVGLVHMNGRVYDPVVGRFLSGDPLVQDPTNGQNYNRYSYVLNNPTNLTDPTGFAACDRGDDCAETRDKLMPLPRTTGSIAGTLAGVEVAFFGDVSASSATTASTRATKNSEGTQVDDGKSGGVKGGGSANNNDHSSTQAAANGATIYAGQQLGDAGAARQEYGERVKELDPTDKAGRKALKEEIRGKTPKTVLDFIESARPSTDAKPGSGGTANRSNAAVDALGKGFKYVGRGLIAIDLAIQATEVYRSNNKPLALMRSGGEILGGLGGGAAGAFGGSFVAPGPGTVAGGLLGGAVGGAAGSAAGEKLYYSIYGR